MEGETSIEARAAGAQRLLGSMEKEQKLIGIDVRRADSRQEQWHGGLVLRSTFGEKFKVAVSRRSVALHFSSRDSVRTMHHHQIQDAEPRTEPVT